VDVLVTKAIRAAKRLGVRWVTASGGVTCNRRLRAELQAGCAREGLNLRLAERSLCTDNAAMIGILAERKLKRAMAGSDAQPAPSVSDLDEEVLPSWNL
jgi:N6-L-threonylcarbamoyladenine synthase